MTLFLLSMALLLLVLALLGAVADSWEARDAKRRNHVRRPR